MKRIKIAVTILIVFFSLIFIGFVAISPSQAEIKCPSNIDPNSQACVDYLNKQLAELQKDKKDLQTQLKEEEYQQLSLSEKISYMQKQISDTEKVIKSLEVDIAAHDVEIKLLEKSILEKEDNISLLRQEADQLEKTVSKRVSESYKYSFVGPFEVFMDVTNLSTILRKTKYLAVTRTQDREAIESFSSTMSQLKDEEVVLAKEKSDLQLKRNSLEENKVELAEERTKLNSQKAEQAKLLAQSQQREATYRAELSSISKSIAEADKLVTDLILRLYIQNKLGDGVKVSKGTPIGLQGHSGCSFGSHLHFEIRTASGTRINPYTKGYFTGSNSAWTYIYEGKYGVPVTRPMLTGGYISGHQALDMVSRGEGNQEGERYKVPYGLCSIVDNILNCRRYGGKYCSNPYAKPVKDWNLAYLTGEGAYIRAVASGRVYYGVESMWKGKYALVVHDDGNKSFYLHLK